MTIYGQVYPITKFPEKSQIEQMYRVAYRHDQSFFRPEDEAAFGLNVKLLEGDECDVEMKESLDRLRKQVPALWARMTKDMQAMFLLTYINPGISYVEGILEQLGQVLGKELPFPKQLEVLHTEIVKAVCDAQLQAGAAARRDFRKPVYRKPAELLDAIFEDGFNLQASSAVGDDFLDGKEGGSAAPLRDEIF